eukprot:1724367-Prymnesium_polylepis.2
MPVITLITLPTFVPTSYTSSSPPGACRVAAVIPLNMDGVRAAQYELWAFGWATAFDGASADARPLGFTGVVQSVLSRPRPQASMSTTGSPSPVPLPA